MRNEGRTDPKVEITAPLNPFSLYPMKIDIFTARIPGADCAIARRSTKSSFLR